MFKLRFWKNKGHLSDGSNTQVLESFKRLSNAQAHKTLKWWLSVLRWSSKI